MQSPVESKFRAIVSFFSVALCADITKKKKIRRKKKKTI